MDWKKRAVICRNQIWCNRQFGSAPIGGVRVINEHGSEEYLNQHPKTDWDLKLMEAETKLRR